MQMLGKQMCQVIRDNVTQRNFNKQTLLDSFLFINLVHAIVIYGNNSLLGTGPLSTVIQAVGERSKFLPESFMPLLFSTQTNPQAKETSQSDKLCSTATEKGKSLLFLNMFSF